MDGWGLYLGLIALVLVSVAWWELADVNDRLAALETAVVQQEAQR